MEGSEISLMDVSSEELDDRESGGADEGRILTQPDSTGGRAKEVPVRKRGRPKKVVEEGDDGRVGRYFTYTVNLGKKEDEARVLVTLHIQELRKLLDEQIVGFYSCGHEVAPTTGEHHIQGYLELGSAVSKGYRFATLHTLSCFAELKVKPWIKASRGSALQNIEYTGKASEEGREFETRGRFANAGKGRNAGLLRVQKKIDEGASMVSVFKEEFDISARHYKFFKEYQLLVSPERTLPPVVEYVFGPTGSGKSRYLMEKYGAGFDVYWVDPPKHGEKVWFDGLNKQSVVIFDEWYPGYFGSGHCQFMLRLLDRYPLKVPIHGGLVSFSARTVVFSSNWPINKIDDQKFSGYPWDSTNPLYSRVYLRDPKWIITQIGEYSVGDKHHEPASVAPVMESNGTRLIYGPHVAAQIRRVLELQKNK